MTTALFPVMNDTYKQEHPFELHTKFEEKEGVHYLFIYGQENIAELAGNRQLRALLQVVYAHTNSVHLSIVKEADGRFTAWVNFNKMWMLGKHKVREEALKTACENVIFHLLSSQWVSSVIAGDYLASDEEDHPEYELYQVIKPSRWMSFAIESLLAGAFNLILVTEHSFSVTRHSPGGMKVSMIPMDKDAGEEILYLAEEHSSALLEDAGIPRIEVHTIIADSRVTKMVIGDPKGECIVEEIKERMEDVRLRAAGNKGVLDVEIPANIIKVDTCKYVDPEMDPDYEGESPLKKQRRE